MPHKNFFHTDGTLPPNALYVERPADEQLLKAVLRGEYCNVLTARQMGKSSLMVRAMNRLEQKKVRTAKVDLSRLGVNSSAGAWYLGLLRCLKEEFELGVDEKIWWRERSEQGIVQRFSDFLRAVLLTEIQLRLVVFIDEIDSTLSLPFADDFFAALRVAYNARATDPIYRRLTFVLLGVAHPADLIKDRSRTPYNIGASITLTDFTKAEAQALSPGLETVAPTQAETVLERVLYWTGGHPYLTQRVCAEIAAGASSLWTQEAIDALVQRSFLSDKPFKEVNLQYIDDRIRESPDREKLLNLYRRIWLGEATPDEERDPLKNQLKLAGLLKTDGDKLIVRNRIYKAAFDERWIKERLPLLTTSCITRVAVIVSIIALIAGGVLIYRMQNNEQIQAATFTQGFVDNESAAVKISNLAGLFRLGGAFADEARALFFGLTPQQQRRLFTGLDAPAEVGADLQIVIKGVYTYLEPAGHDEHTRLLEAMVESLSQIEAEFPDSSLLTNEIEAWAAGRRQINGGGEAEEETTVDDEGEEMENEAEDEPAEEALEAYTRAINYNNDNPALYIDRALAHLKQTNYHDALTDFNRALVLEKTRQEQVAGFIQAHPALQDYLAKHAADFPALH